MYRISKAFDFDAAHHLNGLPDGHKCSRLHGHTYRVELILESERLDAVEMVRDYGDLQPFKRWLDENVDHQDLNDIIHQPTTEALAKLFYDTAKLMFTELKIVRVYESSTTWAEYWK